MCNDTLTNLAVDMVGAYFSDSPISIFNKNLIEIEHPLATEVYYDMMTACILAVSPRKIYKN